MGKNFSYNSNKNRPKSDFYQTPYSMTRHLLDRETFEGDIYEPCCGEGAILKVLKEYNYICSGDDLSKGVDFLDCKDKHDNIITNPPYSLALEFILKAKQVAKKKIAMNLPLNYLHGIERYNKVWQDKDFRLSKVYVFCRYPLLDQDIREDGKYKTGMMVYAWYIWDKDYLRENPTIHWIDNNGDVINSKAEKD